MSIDRDFMAQLLIVMAVCAGAWLMLVQPKAREMARLERQLAEAAKAAAGSPQDGLETLAARFASSKKNLVEIQRRNGQADDTSSLYATMMRLATETNVRVQALQPTPPRQSNGKPEPVRVARLEMTLSGPYENVARFLDRVGEIDAFVRPSALQLIPIDEPNSQKVSARFACDVLAFTVDGALAASGESKHAQP